MKGAKAIIRPLALKLFGSYQINRVYRLEHPLPHPAIPTGARLIHLSDSELSELRVNIDPKVRKSAGYAGTGVEGFGLVSNDRLASVAFFADRDAFANDNVWPLKRGEAALVELITLAEHRGNGFAPQLIMHASNEMFEMGFERLYSWLWWSNGPSERAFQKAGWQYTAFTIEVYPFGSSRPRIWRRVVA